MSGPSKEQIIRSYRHLYKGLLQGVQYSKPARYFARDEIRHAFRIEPASAYSQQRIDNTVEFLGYAARESGLEHKILRNLLIMKWWNKTKSKNSRQLPRHGNRPGKITVAEEIKRTNMVNFEMTLAMLNDSMGLCLR